MFRTGTLCQKVKKYFDLLLLCQKERKTIFPLENEEKIKCEDEIYDRKF